MPFRCIMPALNRLSNTHYITQTLFPNTLSQQCLFVCLVILPCLSCIFDCIQMPVPLHDILSSFISVLLLSQGSMQEDKIADRGDLQTQVCDCGECKPILPPPPMSSATREFKFNKMVYFNSDNTYLICRTVIKCIFGNTIKIHDACKQSGHIQYVVFGVLHRSENKLASDEIKQDLQHSRDSRVQNSIYRRTMYHSIHQRGQEE